MKNLSIERMEQITGAQEYAGQCFFALPLYALNFANPHTSVYHATVVELCWNS